MLEPYGDGGSSGEAPSRAAARATTLRELLDGALEEAVALSGSEYGYLYFYDEETRQFTLHAWSQAALRVCSITDPSRVYHLDGTGLWGDVIRERRALVVNDFETSPSRRGQPAGHPRIRRFMSTPIREGERIVAVVGVANKDAPYGAEDLERLDRFVHDLWPRASGMAAEERRAKLSAIVEQSRAAIATFDVAGRIDYVNSRFVEWLGPGRERLLGRHVEDLNPAQAADPAAFWDWLRAGGTWEREVELTSNGESRWARVLAMPLRGASGDVTHYAVTLDDVSERRELEAELRHVQRLEAVGTLAGGVAHDFNNILTGAVGLASAVRDSLPGEHAARPDLDELLGVLRRASALTRSLLTFAHRQPQRGGADAEPLARIIGGIGHLLRTAVGDDVVLEVAVAPDLVADVDQSHLEQVLVNLATNARDAMPSGGTLRVTARRAEVEPAQAERHRVEPGPYAVLSVEDSGQGMDARTLARIFDPFFTTKEVGKGTGLGLSIVYGIVRQHGGFVEVRSTPGQGSRFDVHFPARDGRAREVRAGNGSPAPHGRGETILLAEDDPVVLGVWASILRRHGYGVVPVPDGEAAVAAFRGADRRVDLAVLDVTMPRLGGIDAAAALRRIDPGLRVVFVSGYPLRGSAGADETPPRVLEKPLPPEELLRAVRRELDGEEARA